MSTFQQAVANRNAAIAAVSNGIKSELREKFEEASVTTHSSFYIRADVDPKISAELVAQIMNEFIAEVKWNLELVKAKVYTDNHEQVINITFNY
jgi:hypothetical protein